MLSTTGYAQVSRSIGNIISKHYELYCVSLHEDQSDKEEIAPGKLITDDNIRDLSESRQTIVINHTTPDHFLSTPNAFNIGLTAWETRAIPRHLNWPECIQQMDAMWGPTTFVTDFIKSCDFEGPIRVTPWPHNFPMSTNLVKKSQSDIQFDLLSKMPNENISASWSSVTLNSLRGDGVNIYLAIQSLSPRKGLPVLMSEWRQYVRATPNDNSVLLLKLNFRHAHGIYGEPKEYLVKMLYRFGFSSDEIVRVALISRSLCNEDMEILTAKSDVFVTASYGEGFGLPVIEALKFDTPVIASRHTGIADLLPDDYPLQFSSRLLCIQLRDLIDVYPPSASWHIADEGSLADAFLRFRDMSGIEKQTALQMGREHAFKFCNALVAERILCCAIEEAAAIHADRSNR